MPGRNPGVPVAFKHHLRAIMHADLPPAGQFIRLGTPGKHAPALQPRGAPRGRAACLLRSGSG